MANKLNPKVVSLSFAAVAAILSLLCALLLALMPDVAFKFFGSIFHGIDISKIIAPMTVYGVLTGLVAVVVIALVFGWLLAVIYNHLSRKMK